MHGEANTMHERLVAYVHTLAHGSRRGVWGEHSYARSRIGARSPGGGGRVRALLAPRPLSPPPALLDVTTPPSPPPSPPHSDSSSGPPSPEHSEPDDDTHFDDRDDDEDWEESACAAAPGAEHARLLRSAAAALTDLRLERLAGGGREARREATRNAARRLRRALALCGAARGPAQWVHGTLRARLPRALRPLYARVARELGEQAPRLAERLTGAPVVVPRRAAHPLAVGPESEPWLVWVSSGSEQTDARWERRLAALVHTRVLRLPRGEAAPPEPWAASTVAAVRHMLTDALADAGERSVVVGGAGAGAGVAAWLARGCGAGGAGGVRGAVCVGAGGAGGGAALRALRLPLLAVEGGAGAVCAAAAARLLQVRGADASLLLPRALRRRHALPQRALDAALVEECVRWAVEAAESEEPASPPRRRSPPRARALRVPADDTSEEEEYSHLPAAGPPAPITVVGAEGRVVSRGAGGTPLTLLPPARGGAAPALAPADIMQLPIVFADDAPPPSPLTVTSGGGGGSSVKLTRVILAKRGAGAGAGAGEGVAGGGGRGVLVRRGVRVLPSRNNVPR